MVVAILFNKSRSACSLIISNPLGLITLVEANPSVPYAYLIALWNEGVGGSMVGSIRRRGAPATISSIQTRVI